MKGEHSMLGLVINYILGALRWIDSLPGVSNTLGTRI